MPQHLHTIPDEHLYALANFSTFMILLKYNIKENDKKEKKILKPV
jgi:hypothetical protein